MRFLPLLLCALGATAIHAAPPFEPNYDESLANPLPIPDVLVAGDGSRIADRDAWEKRRRPELLSLFSSEVYGRTPQKAVPAAYSPIGEDKEVFGGKGLMRQIEMRLGEGETQRSAQILLYLPAGAKDEPAPVFVMLNFWGNHSLGEDADIVLNPGWFRSNQDKQIVGNRATEASRGVSAARFPIEAILDRGYALATTYYGDFSPDRRDGFGDGVHALFDRDDEAEPAGDAWGNIGAWAWGLSRMADHLVGLPEIDPGRIAVLGHSRLGKTALWAGAQDERFALVISNNSGEGGASLAKRNFGETVGRLNETVPRWFCPNYDKYSKNEAALPMDQHALVALMAPRPVYIASATEDLWADPLGEFLAGKLAGPVYALYGKEGLGVTGQPAPDTPVGGAIGYHLRAGKHDLTAYDWQRFMDFADRQWSR